MLRGVKKKWKILKVEGIGIMNKNILLVADLVSQSKNKFIFIWNGLLSSFGDVEILKMIKSGQNPQQLMIDFLSQSVGDNPVF